MGRGYTCYEGIAGNRRCYGKIMNAYVREGTPSKWRVVGKVCNRCYDFSPASGSAASAGAAAGAGSAGSSS